LWQDAEEDMGKCQNEDDWRKCLIEQACKTQQYCPGLFFKWSEQGCNGGLAFGLEQPKPNAPQPAHDWTGITGYTKTGDAIYDRRCNTAGAEENNEPCWVWSEKAQRCYLSTWAGQPSGDFMSPEWVAYVQGGLSFLIDAGFDGIVLDAPDAYICADSYCWHSTDGSQSVQETISSYVRKEGQGTVAVFAELYDKPFQAALFGLDANLGGQLAPLGTAIPEAILANSADADKGTIE